MTEPPPYDRAADVATDPLPQLVQSLADRVAAAAATWERVERQVIPILERIALALERGAVLAATNGGAGDRPAQQPGASDSPGEPGIAAEFRAAVNDGQWDHAAAIVATLAQQPGMEGRGELLGVELSRARERAVARLTDQIEAARQANDAAGALEARDALASVLADDALRAVDRDLIGWLMKLIQRRLRVIPVGSDLAALVGQVADRFGGTPEGASLRAALPTLRRSAGLCPRCAEPYLGVDDACPQCLARSGQAPSPAPTLTFVAADDDLDTLAGKSAPVDLNKVETWQLP